MPFCRKCGRRLKEYSESCTDCGTSTTATLIKIRKTSASKIARAAAPTKLAQAIAPVIPAASIRVFSTAKPVKKIIPFEAAKPVTYPKVSLKHKDIIAKLAKTTINHAPKIIELKPAKTKVTAQEKTFYPSKPATPAVDYPPHEIIKSNLSIEEDIITNPQDYETQQFSFDLSCPYGHFWRAGRALPISNGKAYCPKCGEGLRKSKSKKQRRHHRY